MEWRTFLLAAVLCLMCSARGEPLCRNSQTLRSSLHTTRQLTEKLLQNNQRTESRLHLIGGCWIDKPCTRENNCTAANKPTCLRNPFDALQRAKQVAMFLAKPVVHFMFANATNQTSTTNSTNTNDTTPIQTNESPKIVWLQKHTKWTQLDLSENDTTHEAQTVLLKRVATNRTLVTENIATSHNETQGDNSNSNSNKLNLRHVSSGAERAQARQDITEQSAVMLAIREEMCLRRIRGDISTALTTQVFAQTMEGVFAQTQGFLDAIFDAIGAPLLEALGYIIGLFLLSLMGRNFLNKIVKVITQLLPGCIDLVLVPVLSDMTIQTVGSGVVYAVTDGSVPAIIATMRVTIMAALTSYMATTIGPQMQHRISHQASQAIIRETSHKVLHHVVDGLTHSVTHVVMHKVIHQFLCIYCYYHGQYCEKCFYYGETIPLLQNSNTTPKSFGPFGTSENGAIADAYNFATHAVPMSLFKSASKPANQLELKGRKEQEDFVKKHREPEWSQDPKAIGGGWLRATD